MNLLEIVQTISKSKEKNLKQDSELKAFEQAFELARRNVVSQIERWRGGLSFDQQALLSDETVLEDRIMEAIPDARMMKNLDHFFVDYYIPLADRTRSIVDFSVVAFLDPLVRDPIYSLFCHRPSTLTPENSLQGKIILINLPVKDFHKVGQDIQILIKYVWQRAMERRDIHENGRPVFLWADEAQTFIHPRDTEFQATARSSRVVTVYLSQNLSNLHASMGGDKSEHRVKSFLGTMGTKIFHANADADTNEYASSLIGNAYFVDENESVTVSQNFSQTQGKSLKLERVVRPEEFISLRTGGPINDFRVEGYLHRQGNSILNGKAYIKMAFNQLYQP